MSGSARYRSLREALAADALEAIRAAAKDAKPDHKLAEVALPAGDPNPEKILCAGINYATTPPRSGASCPSSRACSSASPTR